MHEWALAEAILASVKEFAKKEQIREVKDVTIKIGELQQVEAPILRFALNEMKQPMLKNVKFHIQRAKSTLKCGACEMEWTFSTKKMDKETVEAIHFIPEVAHSYVKCPKCGSPDFKIVSGRGVWLESIKGEK